MLDIDTRNQYYRNAHQIETIQIAFFLATKEAGLVCKPPVFFGAHSGFFLMELNVGIRISRSRKYLSNDVA